MSKIIDCIAYANKKHSGQTRRETGCPYIQHPMIVSEFVRTYKESKNIVSMVCAALLHDVIEDCIEGDTTEELSKNLKKTKLEIKEKFGEMTLSLVEELTSDDEEIKRIGKNAHLIKKMLKMSSYALVIKLCDRLSNVVDKPKMKYLEDTAELMLALEERKLSNTHRAIMIEINKVVIKRLTK